MNEVHEALTIVVLTHNRRAEVLATMESMLRLVESSDGRGV